MKLVQESLNEFEEYQDPNEMAGMTLTSLENIAWYIANKYNLKYTPTGEADQVELQYKHHIYTIYSDDSPNKYSVYVEDTNESIDDIDQENNITKEEVIEWLEYRIKRDIRDLPILKSIL